jgi:hypothetical protein
MKLTKLEIMMAGQGIQEIGGVKLPVQTSMGIAKLAVLLTKTLKPIEKERKAIVQEYTKLNENHTQIQPSGEEREKMQERIDILMEGEVDIDFKDKIKLPPMVSSTCDKCHHNMDKPFEIESNILTLLEPFIEV